MNSISKKKNNLVYIGIGVFITVASSPIWTNWIVAHDYGFVGDKSDWITFSATVVGGIGGGLVGGLVAYYIAKEGMKEQKILAQEQHKEQVEHDREQARNEREFQFKYERINVLINVLEEFDLKILDFHFNLNEKQFSIEIMMSFMKERRNFIENTHNFISTNKLFFSDINDCLNNFLKEEVSNFNEREKTIMPIKKFSSIAGRDELEKHINNLDFETYKIITYNLKKRNSEIIELCYDEIRKYF